jgi:hypothetical protein
LFFLWRQRSCATPSLSASADGGESNDVVFPFDTFSNSDVSPAVSDLEAGSFDLDQGSASDEEAASDDELETSEDEDSDNEEPDFEPENIDSDLENAADSLGGTDDLEVSSDSCTATLSGGNGFIQIGFWRFGRVDDNHFSFSSNNGRTAVILRSDGTVHHGNGHRTDWGLSGLPITWTYSAANPNALNSLPNVQFGTSWVQFGSNCRIGTPDNAHLSVSFQTPCCGQSGIHTAGIVLLHVRQKLRYDFAATISMIFVLAFGVLVC